MLEVVLGRVKIAQKPKSPKDANSCIEERPRISGSKSTPLKSLLFSIVLLVHWSTHRKKPPITRLPFPRKCAVKRGFRSTGPVLPLLNKDTRIKPILKQTAAGWHCCFVRKPLRTCVRGLSAPELTERHFGCKWLPWGSSARAH